MNLLQPGSAGTSSEIVLYVLVLVIGACIGSFLNVVIYRVPAQKSLLTSSTCPGCSAAIPFYYNLPIFGWFILRGKCASCGSTIAWRYPAVELLTAIVFVCVYWQFGLTPFLPFALVFCSVMIALIFIDADHMILPNVITYPLVVFAIAARAALPLIWPESTYFSDVKAAPLNSLFYLGYSPVVVNLFGALLGATLGAGSLWLIGVIWKALRKVDAMGLGDVKLLLGIGAFLGWRLTLLTIFLGAFTGALAGIIVLFKSEDKNLQTQIPFGIFLGAGAIISLLFGDALIGWYLGQFY